MKHLNPWEEGLRNQLSSHQSVPPVNGWERLEASLATKKITKQKPFYLKPSFIATACSVAACLTMVVLLNPSATNNELNIQNKKTAKTTLTQVKPIATLSSLTQGASVNSNTPCQIVVSQQQRTTSHRLNVNNNTHTNEKSANSCSNTYTLQGNATQDKELTPTQNSTTSLSKSPSHQRYTTKSTNHCTTRTLPRAASTRTNHSAERQINIHQLALHTSATPSFHQHEAGYYAKANAYVSSEATLNNGKGQSADMAMLMGKNINRDVQTRVSHRTPFQAGLSLTIKLNKRWSLGTGITYTHLSSDIESGSDVSFYHTEQHLHYVGIPLQANYTAFKSRPFNAYLTAGAQLEKCIKGSQNTSFHIDNAYKSNASHNKHLGNGLWQASVNIAAGLQANLTKSIGLYFEPGITYFIPDGSSLLTIRHEKPWQFTMQGGLRFTFGK